MEKVFNHGNRWKKQKGLTLVEIIISIAVVSIISVAALSLSIFATNAVYRERARGFFIRETANIATMYRNYNEADFIKAFKYSTNVELEGYNDTRLYYASDYSYADASSYEYYLDIDFSETELSLLAYNSKANEIYTRSITR